MSRFTTEIRFMLETQYGLEHTGSASQVNEIIDNTREWLFDFDYPCDNMTDSEKIHFEKNFMLHYYTREIGFETFGLFKLKLQSKLWEIMPYYDKLYALEHKNLDFFDDVDFHKISQGKTNKRTGNITHVNSGKQINTTTGGYQDQNSGNITDTHTGKVKETTGGQDTNVTSNSYTDANTGSDVSIYSDTPQNEIDINTNSAFVTSVNKDNKGTTTTRTYNNLTETSTAGKNRETEFINEQTVSADSKATTRSYQNLKVEDENNKQLVDTFNNLLDEIDLDEHTYGNMGDNINKFIKYKDNILNIEKMIIDNCTDLFMNLWI